MNVIVTGATGFIGKWLVNELLNQQDNVTIIVRNKKRVPKVWETSVKILEISLEQFKTLGRMDFSNDVFDIFFHLAWEGASGEERANVQMQLENVQYTCDAVELAARIQCRSFLNAGSIMEYEAMHYIPKEGTTPGIANIYSTAKLSADFMAKTLAVKEGIDYRNAIISNIYGPGEFSSRFINSTLKKMLNHEEIRLTHGRQLYDFIYVSDAVRAMILVGKKGKSNMAYYIGNPKQRQLKEFILQMKEVTKSKSKLLFGHVPFQGTMLDYHEFAKEDIRNLGFIPEIDFAQGITLTKEWILEEGNGA